MYLKRKSWEDAKIIFMKALDISNNSSLSWLGLGVATLRLSDFSLSEECLTQSNIYEPSNGEAWGYMALLCLKVGKRM
jgi:tetratricopeptide (TPR) repeat protein